jgi:hypothetical protein
MARDEPAPSLLLSLPDPCLLKVLQCCADDDQRSLFSAARAHSRLHQAAALALRSVTAAVDTQQKADDVLFFLGEHGQHIDSVTLRGVVDGSPHVLQLPPNLQLNSLELEWCKLLLHPRPPGFPGLFGSVATAALKQLRLGKCELIDHELAEALSHLPFSLEHLSIDSLAMYSGFAFAQFPPSVFKQLKHLTYFELRGNNIQSNAGMTPQGYVDCW